MLRETLPLILKKSSRVSQLNFKKGHNPEVPCVTGIAFALQNYIFRSRCYTTDLQMGIRELFDKPGAMYHTMTNPSKMDMCPP